MLDGALDCSSFNCFAGRVCSANHPSLTHSRPAGTMTYGRLCELLDGYTYLHQTVGYVHRDLEVKHVGLAGGRLCVFDLSTSVPLPSHPHPDSEAAAGVGRYSGASMLVQFLCWPCMLGSWRCCCASVLMRSASSGRCASGFRALRLFQRPCVYCVLCFLVPAPAHLLAQH